MARVKIHVPCQMPLAECCCPPDDDEPDSLDESSDEDAESGG